MSDDVLERVKMCVAEAGYDPMTVRRPVEDVEAGVEIEFETRLDLPDDVYWRARELSGVGDPICLACCVETPEEYVEHAKCLAPTRLVLDCGVQR